VRNHAGRNHTGRGQPSGGPSRASQRGLNWLNFFIADIQTGFGPFVALYLAAENWLQGEIGLLLTVAGLAGIAAQVPGGALVDWAAAKRLLVGAALAVIAAGAVMFALSANPVIIFIAAALQGSTAGILKPATAAIALGLVGHRAFSRRLGLNHRYDSLGNAVTAALMGALGHTVSKQAIFLLAAALCLPAGWALTRIRRDEIDYARARAARQRDKPRDATRLRDLAKNRNLLVFVASLTLFQFVNASVMPLASGRLGQQHQAASELLLSALVVVPQLVTASIASSIARLADGSGRKPLLLAGFGAVPIHTILFAFLAPGSWYLVAVQLLDGLTAAIIGIMMPLVIADVTRGTGRYNLAQGMAGTATGIGASLSTVLSGYAAQLFGYATGFLALAAVGLIGVAVILWFLPETQPEDHRPRPTSARRRHADCTT
jgi:MFS family permease